MLGTNIEAPYLRLAASSLVHPSGAFTRGLNSGHKPSCPWQARRILSTSARAGSIALQEMAAKAMQKMRRRIAVKLDRAVSRGAELAVPRDVLPELPADSYYVVELVGLEVVDEHGALVGSVRVVLPGPANDVLELDSGLLLPLVEACVREVDITGGRILLNPGFID